MLSAAVVVCALKVNDAFFFFNIIWAVPCKNMSWANEDSKGLDLPAYPHSLIRALAFC